MTLSERAALNEDYRIAIEDLFERPMWEREVLSHGLFFFVYPYLHAYYKVVTVHEAQVYC